MAGDEKLSPTRRLRIGALLVLIATPCVLRLLVVPHRGFGPDELDTGVYTILVSDFIPLGGPGGYELNLQFTTGHCAQSISCGQTLSGNLTGISQHNTYSFSGSADQKVTITSVKTSGTLSAYAHLYGPTGTPIAGNAGDGSTGEITLPSAGVYTIDVSDFIPLGGTGAYNLTLSCVATPCNYSISPTVRPFSAAGGSDTVSVTAQAGCNWISVSNANWITITSGSTGSGNGVANYSVSANTTAVSRTGTLTIAGLIFTVTQDGAGEVTTFIFPSLANTSSSSNPEAPCTQASPSQAWATRRQG